MEVASFSYNWDNNTCALFRCPLYIVNAGSTLKLIDYIIQSYIVNFTERKILKHSPRTKVDSR